MSDTVNNISVAISIRGKTYHKTCLCMEEPTRGSLQYELDKMLLEISQEINKDFPT